MNYTISSLDPVEIKRQSEKGRVVAAKRYYYIRKDFDRRRWFNYESPYSVLHSMDGLLDECILKMQTKLDTTPLESRCCDWAAMSSGGIHVHLRWSRFTEQDRKMYTEKYGDKHTMNDYVSLGITFDIIDSYTHREDTYDIHKP